MAQANATAYLYVYISGTWTALDDVQPWKMTWGMNDDSPLSMVADIGELSFRLNNRTGKYTPGGPSALSGWQTGLPVIMIVTYDSESYRRFYGTISDIKLRPSNKDKTVDITVLDWMDYAARHPMKNAGVVTSKRGNQVLDMLMADLDVPPLQTDFSTGTVVFPTAFDAINTKTKAYDEFAKVSFSELGPIYLRKDKYNGETLVMENARDRQGWRDAGNIPLASADSAFLLKEDASLLLLENGDDLILNETAAQVFDGSVITDYEAVYGDRIINYITNFAYPRRLDSSPQVLFQLDDDAHFAIGSGNTYTLIGTYADPAGGGQINGNNMITPVATTDYLFNTQEDGSGSDITSDVTISVTYLANRFAARITNNNVSTGYITKFNVRGYGIYVYNPIQHVAQNSDSIAQYDIHSATLNQRYKTNLYNGATFVDAIVDEHGKPRMSLKSITFCANRSPSLMMAFLNTDVGDIREISISELGVSGNYIIQGVEAEFRSGLIFCKWIVKYKPSLLSGYTPISVEFPATGNPDAVDFGYLPLISGVPTERTFAAWVYPTRLDGTRTVIGVHADSGGMLMYLNTTSVWLYSNRYNAALGWWHSNTTALATNTWYHIVVSYNHTSTSNDPQMWINGVAQAVVEDSAPSGTLNSEVGVHTVIGNVKTATIDYTWVFSGKIFDARIYDRFFTTAEALSLYNGGTKSEAATPTDMIFQAFAVRTDETSDFIDVTLTDDLRLRDNALGFVGTPHGSPIGRAAP